MSLRPVLLDQTNVPHPNYDVSLFFSCASAHFSATEPSQPSIRPGMRVLSERSEPKDLSSNAYIQPLSFQSHAHSLHVTASLQPLSRQSLPHSFPSNGGGVWFVQESPGEFSNPLPWCSTSAFPSILVSHRDLLPSIREIPRNPRHPISRLFFQVVYLDQWSYHQTAILSRLKSCVSHSYENCRRGGEFFPNRNSTHKE